MSDRDPRIDPKPGDVVGNNYRTFFVTRVDGDEIFYTEGCPPPPELSVNLDDWRVYAKGDKVFATAEDRS